MTWFSSLWRKHKHTHHGSHSPKADTLVLESCPLHTERTIWAVHAPAQVDAACKRGADVIGFTEVQTHLVPELSSVAAKNGYAFYHWGGDVAVAYKMTLNATTSHTAIGGLSNPLVHVVFDFHGSTVEVIALHWLTHHANHVAGRAAQTSALIDAMDAAYSKGRHGFYLADSNPSKAQSDPLSEPRRQLDAAGLPLAAEVCGFPAGLGVTTVGYDRFDTTIKPVRLVLGDALGSDHQPATVTFRVQRVQ